MIDRVLELMRNSEKSENALEKAIGLAQGSIKNWRNGKSKPVAISSMPHITQDIVLCGVILYNILIF